jgi:hypothetical protein
MSEPEYITINKAQVQAVIDFVYKSGGSGISVMPNGPTLNGDDRARFLIAVGHPKWAKCDEHGLPNRLYNGGVVGCTRCMTNEKGCPGCDWVTTAEGREFWRLFDDHCLEENGCSFPVHPARAATDQEKQGKR